MQDTPSIKSTYELEIFTPRSIVARASGNMTSESFVNQKRKTVFTMNIPVESYLIAVAAGNLVENKVGDRTYVITEPEMIQDAANELDALDDAIIKLENYLKMPYEWGDYKILILPPSFPFGGMENPLLTFASPTIIVGDKSGVAVANHEIAHSWTGNLVTNMNWDNFWLNEGFTVFSERKVTEMIYGESFMKVAAKVGNSSMYNDMLDYGLDNKYSSLTPHCDGENPDDAFSTIPYEKGFQLLYFLESLVGKTNFALFMHDYLVKF
jgi:leukotriene-A4 hydrolase